MNALSGKRVLVTRPHAQSAEFIARLSELGAVPLVFPTIEIAPIVDTALLDRAIRELSSFGWVVFTSVNGVEFFWRRLSELGQAFPSGPRVAAIGPATAQALRERSVQPSFVPAEYVAEAILPGLGEVRGQRILLARAEIARKALLNALKEKGALPEEVPVYRTVPAPLDPAVLALLEQGVDVATFTSSSTVQFFYELMGGRAADLLRGARIACIGPITAATARALGLTVDCVASEYTVEGLIAALQGSSS